jgi:hypothetical protein
MTALAGRQLASPLSKTTKYPCISRRTRYIEVRPFSGWWISWLTSCISYKWWVTYDNIYWFWDWRWMVRQSTFSNHSLPKVNMMNAQATKHSWSQHSWVSMMIRIFLKSWGWRFHAWIIRRHLISPAGITLRRWWRLVKPPLCLNCWTDLALTRSISPGFTCCQGMESGISVKSYKENDRGRRRLRRQTDESENSIEES